MKQRRSTLDTLTLEFRAASARRASFRMLDIYVTNNRWAGNRGLGYSRNRLTSKVVRSSAYILIGCSRMGFQ